MIIESNNFNSGVELNYDICIIGAGAAGITIAKELRLDSHKICLLESGGLDYSRKTQQLYCGQISGDRYSSLHLSRLRYYGGSTNHWGGACLPLDDFDFSKRDWIPFSGWPISFADINPYYRRAHEFLELGEYNYEYIQNASENDEYNLYDQNIFNKLSRHTRLDAEIFGSNFIDEFRNSRNIDLITSANVTNLACNSGGNLIEKVAVQTVSGKSFFVNAKNFILASGGIENPRLLLISNKVHESGIGNGHDQVGRYFTDHLFFYSGVLQSDKMIMKKILNSSTHSMFNTKGYRELITPDYNYLSNNRVLNFYSYLLTRPDYKLTKDYYKEGNQSAMIIKDDMLNARIPIDFILHLKTVLNDAGILLKLFFDKLKGGIQYNNQLTVRSCIELAPDPENRVMLSQKKDKLGINQVNLKWKLRDLDKYTVIKLHEFLEMKFRKSDIFNLKVNENFIDQQFPYSYESGHHHTGTTKMSDNPKKGVVDKDCKVHGVSNLYIAGSSVFPTAGVANPTLTIIALAIRLSDHISNKISRKARLLLS